MTKTSLTDIVIDVAQAADPQRLAAARQRLLDRSAFVSSQAGNFEGLAAKSYAETANASVSVFNNATPIPARYQNGNALRATTDAATIAQKFEAFILQSMIETILPKEGGAAFGHGAGAGVWRSMLAEQLANQIAKSGGVGLQKSINAHIKTQGGSHSPG